jgi:hypothetical protein
MNTMRALRETLEGGVILPEPFATDATRVRARSGSLRTLGTVVNAIPQSS